MAISIPDPVMYVADAMFPGPYEPCRVCCQRMMRTAPALRHTSRVQREMNSGVGDHVDWVLRHISSTLVTCPLDDAFLGRRRRWTMHIRHSRIHRAPLDEMLVSAWHTAGSPCFCPVAARRNVYRPRVRRHPCRFAPLLDNLGRVSGIRCLTCRVTLDRLHAGEWARFSVAFVGAVIFVYGAGRVAN